MPLRAETMKFSVFYPVTREQRAETGSLVTAFSSEESISNLISALRWGAAGAGERAEKLGGNGIRTAGPFHEFAPSFRAAGVRKSQVLHLADALSGFTAAPASARATTMGSSHDLCKIVR